MTKVRDVRATIENAVGGFDSDPAVTEFLRVVADFDDMDIGEFFRRLRGERGQSPKADTTPKANVDEIVSRLKSAMPNDDAFHRAIDSLNGQRAVTKSILTQVFYALFNRTKGVPSKATRADLLRLIEDERNILVRNQKMGEMLGRRPVPAE